MPPGKQATPGIFSFLIRNGCGKVQDAPSNLFPVFFPLALSIGSAFINSTPTFFLGGSFCVSHSLRDWGEEQDHPSEKMRRCITGEPSLAAGKISRAFQIVPPSLRAVWKSPWGLAFLCNPGSKTLLPPFLPGGNFCVSHSLRDCEEEQDSPSTKIRRCITGESALAGEKSSALSRLSRHRSGQFGKALGV